MINRTTLLAEYTRRAKLISTMKHSPLLNTDGTISNFGCALLLVGLFAGTSNPWVCLNRGENHLRLRICQRKVRLPEPRYCAALDEYVTHRWVGTGALQVELVRGPSDGYGHGREILGSRYIHRNSTPNQVITAIEGFLAEQDRIDAEDAAREAAGSRLSEVAGPRLSEARRQKKAS